MTSLGMCQARISSEQPTATAKARRTPRPADAAGAGRRAPRRATSVERRGRVAARPGGRRRCAAPPTCGCGWASSGLSVSAVERRERHHRSDRDRHPRAAASERHGDSAMPRDERSGSSRCSRKSPTWSTPGRPSMVKPWSAAVPEMRGGHELGEAPRTRPSRQSAARASGAARAAAQRLSAQALRLDGLGGVGVRSAST